MRPWKLPSVYQRPCGSFAAVCHSGGVFVSPLPDFVYCRHRAAMGPHVQLDVRRGEGRGSGSRQGIDLVVMVAGQDAERACDVDLVRRVRRSRRPTGLPRQQLQRFSEHVVVEHFRAGAEVCHAVDLRGMTDQAIDRPHERLVHRSARRHPERHHPWVVAPQHEPDLVANDGVDIPHHRLRDQVLLEQRLRNPGGAVVGLIDEVEQCPPAIPLRSRIGLAPAIHNVRMSESNVAASVSSGSPVSGAIAGRDNRRTQAHTSMAASTAADVRLLTNIGTSGGRR